MASPHARPAPVGGRIVTPFFLLLCVIMAAAAAVLAQRFVFGLGSATHLGDGYPWGIWIAIDLIIGTAFGCGGLTIAWLVYIFNKGEYSPLMRAALMTSLFGYALGGAAVMIDLGRWWQGYNIMLPWLWNSRSVMLETALCIMVYIIVLMFEFAPALLERLKMRESKRALGKLMFLFTGLGALLPMMHQSSMGTIVILLGYKLSPLWQSDLLTIYFLITAFTMGYAVVCFESILGAVGLRRPIEMPVLSKISGIMLWIMLGFMTLRFVDLSYIGAWPLAFAGGIKATWFWIEMLCGAAVVALLIPEGNRSQPRALFLAASLMLTHGFLYRLNCYLIGYDPGAQYSYFPSIGEVLVTLGIVAFHLAAYLVIVRSLPVLPAVGKTKPLPAATVATNH
jgi:Ni/Fe-hydrogenase subunit HybB-like protein